MYKFLVALFLLYVPASMSALAHSGTDQEEKACTRDVQRFCRKLMDQGDLTILACLKENRAKLSRLPLCAGQSRAITGRETALWLFHDAGRLMAVLWMTGHWAGQALVEGGIPFSGGSSNGGFWSRKVENARSFNGD